MLETGQALTNSLMRTPLWRMLLSGNRERIAGAVARINAAGTTDDYAMLLLTIRRRHARKLVVKFAPFTLHYTERERRSALTALGLLWGAVGRELGMALDPKASHFDRRHAHEALARRRDQRAVRPLVEALIAGHALEDWQCIPTLGALGDVRAAEPLLRYMGIDGDYEIDLAHRLDIGIDVGRALRDLNAINALITTKAALESHLPHRRASAALILAGWGDENIGTLLIPLLDDPVPAVRTAALTALGDLKVTAALPALQGRLNDPDPDVQIAAERAYQQVSTAYAQRTVKAGKAGNLKRPDTIPDNIPQK